MQELKSTDYFKAYYDKDKKFMELEWLPNVSELEESQFAQVLLDAHNLLLSYPTELLLQNSEQAVFPFTDEIQEWIEENISKAILTKAGVRRVAFIFPKDYLSRLGLELVVEKLRLNTPSIVRMLFDNREQALDWLFNSKS